MKKVITTLVMVLFAVPLLSLVLVGVAQAQVADGQNCSAVGSTCATPGFSCVGNPKVGLPAGYDATAGRICCSTVWGCFGQGGVENTLGLGNEDPRAIAANVVNVILGFLGIIAVVLILAGGFMWMTAAGNDDKISSAKSLMTAGVIGLVIVLASFGIATFVVNAFLGATGVT
ncbi:MAG: hypothetical protein Q8Q23_05065 [bacterium]|nr:hypothetical protein [bacterium]